MDTSIALALMVARAAIVAVAAGAGAFSEGCVLSKDCALDLVTGLAGGSGADAAASNSMPDGFCTGAVGLVGLMGVVTDVLDVDLAAGLARAATVVAAGGFFATAT